MPLYLVDDGAFNWVIASCKKRVMQVMTSDLGTHISDHEGYKIRRLTKEVASKQSLYDDNEGRTRL